MYKILILISFSFIFSQSILHIPIEESTENNPVLIEAFIDLPEYEIKKVSLFFRKKGDVKYIELPMFKIDVQYLGEIPPNFVTLNGLEYFIIVDTYNMGFIGLPNIDPPNNPFLILGNEKREISSNYLLDELNANYTILSPEPDSRVIDEDVMISISYFEMDNIDIEKVRVYHNEVDVSKFVEFRYNHFVFYPEGDIIGLNNVEVILVDDFQIEYNPIRWSFTAISEDEISIFDLKQSGKFKTNYSNSIIDTTRLAETTTDFIYNAKFDWLELKANFHLSSLENNLDQPYNRFFVDFRSEYYRFRVGDVYPNFGDGFIKRNRIRGLDFNFNSEKYQVNFISGEINRASQGNAFAEAMVVSNLIIDSVYNDQSNFIGLDDPTFDISRDNYTFSRDITGLQFKFPIKKDMSLSFSVLKGKDNIESVYKKVPSAIVEIPNSLNDYIDNTSLIYSTDTRTVENIILDENGDTVDNDGDGEPDTESQIIETNYVTSNNLINNYANIFNSTLVGEGSCVDNQGVPLGQFVSQSDCESANGNWVLEGTCYVQDENGDFVDGNQDGDNDTLAFENQLSCEANGGRWVAFFNINVLEKNWDGVKPKDNIVIGANFEGLFDQKRLKLKTGLSFSLLNENIWDPVLTYESLDTLGGDPQNGALAGYEIPENLDFSQYEDIFQSGINQVPLLPLDIISGQSSLLKVLSMPSLAYNLSLDGDYYGHKLSYKFNQIGPEYNSLGNLYLQQDIREQTLSDKMAFIDNKLYLNLRYKLLEEGIAFDDEEKGKTNKFDILINFSPGANLPRLSSAIGYQNRTNGVTSNDFVEYQLVGETESQIDIDSRKENVETLQYNFALTTPFFFYGNQNITLSYYQSKTEDVHADENILLSMESDETYDAFPYISPRTETNTVNVNWLYEINAFLSSSLSFTGTSFDYGLDISNYYRVLDQNQEVFELDDDYDYNTAYNNILRFEEDYGNILYQDQLLKNIDIQTILKSYMVFDQIKFGLHYSDAAGVIDFNQYGFSFSTLSTIFEDFYLMLEYQMKYKSVSGSEDYNNSQINARFGYQF